VHQIEGALSEPVASEATAHASRFPCQREGISGKSNSRLDLHVIYRTGRVILVHRPRKFLKVATAKQNNW
jgi:hypothetical protein